MGTVRTTITCAENDGMPRYIPKEFTIFIAEMLKREFSRKLLLLSSRNENLSRELRVELSDSKMILSKFDTHYIQWVQEGGGSCSEFLAVSRSSHKSMQQISLSKSRRRINASHDHHEMRR